MYWITIACLFKRIYLKYWIFLILLLEFFFFYQSLHWVSSNVIIIHAFIHFSLCFAIAPVEPACSIIWLMYFVLLWVFYLVVFPLSFLQLLYRAICRLHGSVCVQSSAISFSWGCLSMIASLLFTLRRHHLFFFQSILFSASFFNTTR